MVTEGQIFRQDYRRRLREKLQRYESIVYLIKHYGEHSKEVLSDMVQAVAERYGLDKTFSFLLRTLLVELINNALRENYFYFLAGCLWQEHLTAMQEAGRQEPEKLIRFERYLAHLRSSMTFLDRVRDFNLKRTQYILQKEERQKKLGTRELFAPEEDTLERLNRRYREFCRDKKNVVRLSIHPTAGEISFTIVNRSYLDDIAIHRLRSRVIERLQREENIDINRIEEYLDESQGGAGLGAYVIKQVLSEQGFNTLTESLIVSPDPRRQLVSTTLTLDLSELSRFYVTPPK
ncbi:MAG: hypothetical protein NZM25_00210 [Leptospiraceae bacterium]|nr:hypothetical protein [Leptospiraceae bacterium]